MEKLLFIIYLVFFILLINTIPFFKRAGLNKVVLTGLFVIKVSAGVTYALFYTLPRYSAGSDTWRFYRASVIETKWLLTNPIAFAKDLFVFSYNNSGGLFSGQNSYWNDLKSNVPVKILACLNVITNNSYYTNIIIFNFIFFIGLIALFKVFNDLFPNKKMLVIAGLFFLPSTLFWCSGIHKDGLILSALGMIIYCFHAGLKAGFTIAKIAATLLCLIIIFSLRNYVAIALIPALLCWVLTASFRTVKLSVFITAYLVGTIIFFTAKNVSSKLDFPRYLVTKQEEFSKLEGNSTVNHNSLEPTFISFARFLPTALDMAFLRPHLTEAKSFSYIPAALENILLILILLLALYKGNIKSLQNPMILFCLFFSLTLLLIAGYSITLSGAIVRYRSISLPFLITPLLCIINLKPIRKDCSLSVVLN